jgi:hypothetical protein
MNTQPYYPIGIQTFRDIRDLNAVYVDKTDLVYKLTHSAKFVFLSRPRRFGKSLLCSTLQSYFEGDKELFKGLAMEQLEKEWTRYPVLRFDLSSVKSDDVEKVESNLSRQLKRHEATYGRDEECNTLSGRMANLIEAAHRQSGQKVVVLIDEYDAPILEVIHQDEKREKIRRLLREFYSPLKESDPYLRFVFITGISMFSQMSIFSEMNNLTIITLNSQYAPICGITRSELLSNFKPGIEAMAAQHGCSTDEMVRRLEDMYDGYHFSENSEGLLNPFSLLNAFFEMKLGRYWFRSGTPQSLIEMLRRYKQDGEFRLGNLDNSMPIPADIFESPLETQNGPIPLLYQAGYLTIKSYDPIGSAYVLGIPNSEVRIGLMQNLLPLFTAASASDAANVKCTADYASAALRQGNIDEAMRQFQSMLASVPFMKGDKEILADAAKTEAHYHVLFYFFFRMLSNEVYAEVRNAVGATDVVILTPKQIYVVEIKIDSSADAALKQIDDKGYATPYFTDGRQVIKLGINFSTDTRTVDEWKQAPAN